MSDRELGRLFRETYNQFSGQDPENQSQVYKVIRGAFYYTWVKRQLRRILQEGNSAPELQRLLRHCEENEIPSWNSLVKKISRAREELEELELRIQQLHTYEHLKKKYDELKIAHYALQNRVIPEITEIVDEFVDVFEELKKENASY